jgi:hypothetical protein
MEIYTFPVKGYDIDMTLNDGFLAYTFQRKNPITNEIESFGHKINVKDADSIGLVSAASLLVVNAFESIEGLDQVSIEKEESPTE